ncbi:MAG TPA: FHA domain-containing protein [Anaerolineales bacterium]|nr:FHA domain-containing protein [Anaerolineales bacterium]
MDISEKFCPVCKNKNERDAIICRHCGAALEKYPADDGGKTRTTDMQIQGPEWTKELPIDKAPVPVGGIAVYVEDISKPVFLSSVKEFVIGRKVGGERTETLLDLSPLGGYHLGLSRRHVMIRRAEHGYEVIDLSSSNGTWLNNERLIPNKPYPLASGAKLRLGRMRFFVLYRSVAEAKQKI